MYVVYENIKSDLTLSEVCKTCTPYKFMCYFLQILYSLKIAHREIDYTHFDLHHCNLVLRLVEGNSLFLIKYDNIYLRADGIMTFIDYDRSHIVYENQHFYYGEDSYFRFFRNQSYILYDVYKIFMTCLLTMKQDNFETCMKVWPIYKYFNSTGNINDSLDKQERYYYSMTYYDHFNLDHFILYCRQFMLLQGWDNPVVIRPTKNDVVLECM